MFLDVLRFVHIVGATVLLGSGAAIAFLMFQHALDASIEARLAVARSTVAADLYFTTPAVILQPLSGAILVVVTGYDPTQLWLVATYVLFVVAGLCWLPVVWIQVRMRRLLASAVATGQPLPVQYERLFRIWFILGWPAFASVVAIIYLMVTKPVW